MSKITDKLFAKIVLTLGIIGALASLVLAYEKYSLAVDPEHVTSCSISPIIACETVMSSSADGLLFGIPNAFIGLIAFGALAAVGTMLLAGSQPKVWFWRLFYTITAGGLAMVGFFSFQSLYRLSALCLYCMVVWAVTIPLFVYSSIYLVSKKQINLPKSLKNIWPRIEKNHIGVVVLIYLLIFGLILFKFRDYFESIWL